MKLVAGFVVACIFACVSTSSIFTREDEELRGSGEHEMYKYAFQGQVLAGIPSRGQQYSAMGLKFNVYITKLNTEKYHLRIDYVKLAETSYKNMLKEDFKKTFSGGLKYWRNEHMEHELKKPVIFTKVNGIVSVIEAHKNESLWSINLKKSVMSMLSFNQTEVNKHLKNTIQYTPSVTLNETGLEGKCETTYEFFPVNDGPLTRNSVLTEALRTKLPTSSEVYQFSKTWDLDMCEKRPVVVKYSTDALYCGACGFTEQSRISEFAKTTISFINGKVPEDVIITKALTEGEVLVPKMGEHSAVVSITQMLTLRSQKLLVETPEHYQQEEVTTLHSLRYSVSSGIMNSLHSFRRWDQRPLSSERPSGVEDTVSDAPERELPVEQQNYFLQQRSTLSKSIKFSIIERLQIATDLLKLLHEVSQEILSTKSTHSHSRPLVKVDIMRIISMVDLLDSTILGTVYKKITEQLVPEQQKQIERKFFLDCLTMAGTPASYRMFKTLVENGQIKGAEAVELATGFHEAFIPHSQKTIEAHLELCQSPKVLENHYLHSAVCVSLGRIIRKHCTSVKKQQIINRSLTPKFCQPTVLNRFIERIASKIQSAQSTQQKAVYILTLAETGVKEALKHLTPFTQQSTPFFLRSTAIIFLKHLAVLHPEEVRSIILPIYNNREENTRIRIMAVSVIYSTFPSYPVLKQIAIDVNNETNFDVRSYVYTSMKYFQNVTNTCLKPLASAASKAIIHIDPYKRDNSIAYIRELVDVERRSNIILGYTYSESKIDNEMFLTGRLDNLELDSLLQLVFQTVTVSKDGMGYLRRVLSQLKPSGRNTPVQRGYRMPDEEIGHMTYDSILERTLFSFITSDDDAQNIQLAQSMSNSIIEMLTRNYTGTYVKAMLPNTRYAISPTVFGFPMIFAQLTDVVVAIQGRDLVVRVEPPVSTVADLSKVKRVEFSGTIKPMVSYKSMNFVGLFNPATMRLTSTGSSVLSIINAPVSAQVEVKLENGKATIKSVMKPEVEHMFMHYESYPFTSTADYQSTRPFYLENPAQRIVSPSHIKFDKEVGTDTFGIGVYVRGKSSNPWALHTIPWLKKMTKPVEQLPAAILRLVQNPWLGDRELTISGKRGTQYPTNEIETVLIISNKTTASLTTRDLQGPVDSEYNVTASITLKGEKQREISASAILKLSGDERLIHLSARRSPFQSNETIPSMYTMSWWMSNHTITKQNVEKSFSSEMLLTKSTEPTWSIKVKSNVEEESVDIPSMLQPEKALAQVVKINCEKMKINERRSISQIPRVCQYAVMDKALVHNAVYNVTHKNVQLNVDPAVQFVKYHLYPFMEAKKIQKQQELSPEKINLQLRTVEGTDVTSMKVDWVNQILNFLRIRHESTVVNKVLTYMTRLDACQFQQKRLEILETNNTWGHFEWRNIVRELPEKSETCFSVKPQPQCPKNYTAEHEVNKLVYYICIDSRSSKASELREKAQHEILRELRSKPGNWLVNRRTPVSCRHL